MVDFNLYGGKQGYVKHLNALLLFRLGAYREAADINWAQVSRLVFACKGNICRSPYASARARLLGVPTDSFGFTAKVGSLANPDASRNAKTRGVDLTEHRSADLDTCGIWEGDLLVVFEPPQIIEARRRGICNAQVTLLGIWGDLPRPHIQDPYGQSDRYFQDCFALIDTAVARLVAKVKVRDELT